MLKKTKNRLKNYLNSLGSESGMSLLELMIVITIIGIIAVTIGPKLLNYPKQARVSKAKQLIRDLDNSLSLYQMHNGLYPTTDQGLEALVSKPTVDPIPMNYSPDGYIKRLPKDPWGMAFIYESDGSTYKIIALGEDRQEGGEGYNADISSEDL